MACHFIDDVQKKLLLLKEDTRLTSFMEDQIQTIQLELQFLRAVMLSLHNWLHAVNYQDKTFEDKVEAIACLKDAVQFLFEDANIENFDLLASRFLEKVEYFKPVFKEICIDLSNISWNLSFSDRFKVSIPELMSSAHGNLKALLISKPHMSAPVKNHIRALQESLEFFSIILHFCCREDHDFWVHYKNWVNCTAGVTFLFWIDEEDKTVSAMVSHLLQQLKPCTLEVAQLYLGVLGSLHPSKESDNVLIKSLYPSKESDNVLKRKALAYLLDMLLEDLVLPADDRFEVICEMLMFFISFLVDPPKEYADVAKLTLKETNNLVNEATSLICSLCVGELKEDIAGGRNILLQDLLEKINRAKSEIKELHITRPASMWNNFPKNIGKGFFDFLLENLEKLKHNAFLFSFEKRQIAMVQKELLSLGPFLMDMFEQQDKDEEHRDLWARIVNVQYRMDYVIDSYFCAEAAIWRNMIRLSNVIADIQYVQTGLNKIRDNHMHKTKFISSKMNSNPILPFQANTTRMDEVMVGYTNEAQTIFDRLTNESGKLDIISIVGMPGQGKTTLAKKVYHDCCALLCFNKHAWCCISQAYESKYVLLDILKDINEPVPKGQVHDITHEDLAQRVHRCLKGQKYLIVLDDIWDVNAWYKLKEAFPDDNIGSRILFTSRICNVPLKAQPDCSPLELVPLSFMESWELLQLRLFRGDVCPPHLSIIGKEIAKNCKGLPLSIVLIASLLERTDRKQESWKQINEVLNSQLATEECMNILELSYKHLPEYLRPCFLYFAAFQEDEEIEAKKLTRLWIVEGFIKKDAMKSLEDLANEYLVELVDRSLVSVVQRSSRWGIKTCRIHDLLHKLCIEKVKEERFLMVPYVSNFSSDIISEQHRLCIQTHWRSFVDSEPTGLGVRSLLFTGSWNSLNAHPHAPLFFILFKVLRVLDLENLPIRDHDLVYVTKLIHLRYLALYSDTCSFPSSVVNLLSLEVFRLRTISGAVFLPRIMLKMNNLRHVYVWKGIHFHDNELEESHQLDNIVTFRLLDLRGEEDPEILLRRIQNVHKLGVILNVWVKLSGFLSKLDSLDLCFGEMLSTQIFDFPTTLKKLKLSGPLLLRSMISTIGKLPNLKVLKLAVDDFEDDRWDVEDEEFSNLKYLKLKDSKIKNWTASDYSFTRLQQLVITKCNQLDKIPSSFGEISTLIRIAVRECSNSVFNSVHEIAIEQRNLGNDGFEFPSFLDNNATNKFPDGD